ncbi:Acid phosphatase, class B-like [Parasponia andersonii]|uniref:Acid phosphatase, class B-like n=1 Tax=Parasponia andersonii TaxID=3476 RepID=A0A2P5AIG1_PARAD|nr:Acid phosphatase, class B-like [Parasponia andersonii]
MSAYGHQMERGYSAQSLSSGGGSEGESHYIMETGFYMTSFAATIFIAAIAAVGVLLVTLLITLTVMLQSCQSKSAGVIETQKLDYEYNTCNTLALQAELNNFEASHFPLSCRALFFQYIEEGQYARDLNSTMLVVENHFKSVNPQDDRLDVVLMDIDDVLSSNPQYANLSLQGNCIGDAKHLKHTTILRIYMNLHARGWPLIFLSRKPERQRNITVERLVSAGYSDWSLLIMRSEEELHMDAYEYFSRRRAALTKEGFRIAATISSHYDALTGPNSGKFIFKLPNPIHYYFWASK